MRASSVLFVVVGCAGGAVATRAVAAVGRAVDGADIVASLSGTAVAVAVVVADGTVADWWALLRAEVILPVCVVA